MNSNEQTRRITPMQLPANMLLEVICHVDEMKPRTEELANSLKTPPNSHD